MPRRVRTSGACLTLKPASNGHTTRFLLVLPQPSPFPFEEADVVYLIRLTADPSIPPTLCHLITVPHPSLSAESYHDPVAQPCSTYERLSSSPLLPSSQRLSLPRTTARSSLRHKSLVRIIAVPLRPLSVFAKKFHEDPNVECTVYSYPPVAQNIHNFPTIWQPATLLANDSDGQAFWQKIASGVPNIPPKGQLNGSTINVTYDSANDPDCCK